VRRSRAPSERRTNERDGGSEIAEHELCADANDAKPGTLPALEASVPEHSGRSQSNAPFVREKDTLRAKYVSFATACLHSAPSGIAKRARRRGCTASCESCPEKWRVRYELQCTARERTAMSRELRERCTHERDGGGELAEPSSALTRTMANPRALQLAITARIRARLARVEAPSTSTMSLMLGARKSVMKSPATGTWRRNETPS
jgi:hypothetical protein